MTTEGRGFSLKASPLPETRDKCPAPGTRAHTHSGGWLEGGGILCAVPCPHRRPGPAPHWGTCAGPGSPLRLRSDLWASACVTLLHCTNFVFRAGGPVVNGEAWRLTLRLFKS